MADFFKMPKQGVDMEEGTLIRWLKKEGDEIKKGEMIAEIETDKTTLEVECLCDGIIRKFYCGENDTVPCGTPIAFIGTLEDEIPEVNIGDPGASDGSVTAGEAPGGIASVSSEQAGNVAAEKLETAACESVAEPGSSEAEEDLTDQNGGRVFATPRARKLAAMENIDINDVIGTGPSGRIVEYDVQQFIAQGGSAGSKKSRKKKETVVPFKGVRKATAKHMMESLQGSAQAHMTADIDATNLVSFRTQLNKKYEAVGKKISYLDLIIAASAKALVENPAMNAELREDGIHEKNYANIGVAVNTDKGLFVPVVKDADILSPLEIDKKVKTLVSETRDGKLKGSDMSGGTFTVSNLGMYEIDTFTAILNPPETGILAVSRIQDRVVPVNGQPAVRPVMSICLTYDHRIVDGAPAAAFLTALRHYLENPAWILL